MLPVLLDLKFVKIYTFGVFLVLAFFWGCFMLWRNIRLTSLKEEVIFDGLFLSLAGALFVSRLTYVFLNFEKFGFSFLKFILINGYPGLSMFGALFGGFLTLFLYFLIKKIPIQEAADYFVTPIFLALLFGKMGSFFSGVEAGTKTKFILALNYSGLDGLRHLTPLYESIIFGLAAYLSYRLLFDVRKEKHKRGFVFYFFCWFFALSYFVFDKIKENHLYLVGLSFNKVVSTTLLLLFTFYFIYYFKNSIFSYGSKAYQKIGKTIQRTFIKRASEVGKADSGAQKK